MSDDQIDGMLGDDARSAFIEWQKANEYAERQDALPPHKRDGYADRMYEQADVERKRRKEES